MGKSRKNPSLYQLIDRKKFDQLAEKWNIDKGVRSLTTWELTCALVDFMTLQLESYRDIEETLGIPRSTLSDALAGRCSGFFQDLCDQILLDIRGRTHNRKLKRAIRQLLAIDSTECDVHGSLFDRPKWAKKRGEGRQASCKLHVVWDIDGEWVDDFSITGARKHDSPASLNLRIQSGKTYVFDRAYNDLDFWLKIIGADSHFVTRLKDCQKNADLRMFALAMADGEDGVLYDGDYEPSQSIASRYKEQLQEVHLRHIIYRDPETKKVFDFVTSDVDVPAQEIADIYKRRWAVELLFRWLKGHLKIGRLAVKNANAAEIQLAAAVMFQLLLQLKKMKTKFTGTLWLLLKSIRSCLKRRTMSRSEIPEGCRWRPATTANLNRATG